MNIQLRGRPPIWRQCFCTPTLLKLKTITNPSKVSKKNTASKAATISESSSNNNDSTVILRVSVAERDGDLLFYEGQTIKSPMGIGIVSGIHPISKKLRIKLNYGIMLILCTFEFLK